jgi:Cu/Ag efflux protein CusF
MAARLSIVLVSALAVGLAACGPERHDGRGEVVAIDAAGATIAHEAVPGVLPASTSRFAGASPAALEGLAPGARIRFVVERRDAGLVLVSHEAIARSGDLARHLHDYRAEHGGVVAIVGPLAAEIVASGDGTVRVHLRDAERAPVPVAGTTGAVRLDLPDGPRTLPLVPAGAALEGRTTPIAADAALATLVLERDGRAHETTVLLPLAGKRAGAAGVPPSGCAPPERAADSGPAPRCTVAFGRAVTALAATPDGARVAVAVSHGRTSVWSVPDGRVVMGLEPSPPLPILPGQHEPEVRALAVRPDGGELAVVLRDRIDFFDAATGRFVRAVQSPGGAVQSLAWLADGARLAVASAGDGKARVVAAADARVVRTLPLEGQATAVAAGGRWLAAATDVGTIALVDGSAEAPPRVLAPSLEPAAALAFAGERLVTAGTDGTLRVFDAATGDEAARIDVGAPLLLLAVAPDGGSAATADRERRIRIHRLPDGAVVATRAWHRATVAALAFGAGGALVSGDNDGALAIWDPEPGAAAR